MSIRNGNRCLSILIKNPNSRINPATTAAILQARFNSTSSSSSSTASSSFTLPRFNLPTSSLRLKPTSASYFTGRPIYTDLLLELDRLTNKTKRSLEQNHFLPTNSNLNHLSSSTSTSTLTNKNVWKPSSEMSVLLGTNLKAAQYRSLIKKLSTLYRYRDLVINHLAPIQGGKDRQLAMEVMTLLDSYSRQDLLEGIESEDESKELDQLDSQQASSSSSNSTSSTVESISNLVDEKGRSYALGRRKESSCRVWLIPTKPSSSDPHQTTTPSIGKVLINSQPMSSYFTRTNHRESILHPLKLVGLLGTFNIFTLVKGGGHSGQAGAIAHGLSKALVRWFQHQFLVEKDERKRELLENRWKEVRGILLKDGVLKRDPRMVERKKTGLAKARKAYTWVKR